METSKINEVNNLNQVSKLWANICLWAATHGFTWMCPSKLSQLLSQPPGQPPGTPLLWTECSPLHLEFPSWNLGSWGHWEWLALDEGMSLEHYEGNRGPYRSRGRACFFLCSPLCEDTVTSLQPNSSGTLILGFQPPQLCEIKFCSL